MSNTWIELDLGILRDNLSRLREALRPETHVIFVVKANAYGHGMIPVARCAWDSGVRWFAVAYLSEAAALREALPEAQILIMCGLDPAETAGAIEAKAVPFVVSEQHGRALARAASGIGKTLDVHVKVDTGMGRLGILWEEAAAAAGRLAQEPGLAVRGICTHFASAGTPFAAMQAERFERVVEECRRIGLTELFRHMSNSGGIAVNPGWDLDGVRTGLLLYGYREGRGTRVEGRGFAGHVREIPTRPVLQWKTRVVQVKRVPAGWPISYDSTWTAPRETNIGVVQAGYCDGYSRLLSNRGAVLIRGRRYPVVGRVTMNLTMTDLGAETDVAEGDEAVLLGTQGEEAIRADEMAGWRDTIPYEVLTDIRTSDRRLVGTDRFL